MRARVLRLGPLDLSDWLLFLRVVLFVGVPYIRKIMGKVQLIASFSITGARRSCPALDTILCLAALNLYVKQCAERSAIRLRVLGCWKYRSIGHFRILNIVFPEGTFKNNADNILPLAICLRTLKPDRA